MAADCSAVFRLVEVEGGGRISCPPGTSVLRALAALGRTDVPVGCRSGGCGICRVRVTAGEFTTGRMSASQVDARDIAEGIALACQIYPRSDLRVTVLGLRRSTQ